ncbi:MULTISPECIES: hypothetical protein [Streptomyces]|uniref:hypothetical protein n=1 Tax=Streptomyces TaxID=1883 RepID=UPI00210DEC7F|nr:MULTISPECIES: hypothetical protein [Streptomyces]
MVTHASVPQRLARHRRIKEERRRRHLWVILPISLAVFYGFYAQFIDRSGEGPVTGGQVVLGVVSGLVFGALCLGLGAVQHRLPLQLRAAAFGALTGLAIGWLHSLTSESVLTSIVLSVLIAAATTVGMFYAFYVHDPAYHPANAPDRPQADDSAREPAAPLGREPAHAALRKTRGGAPR